MASINQPTAAPTTKIMASGIGGAISILVVYAAQQVGFDLPAEVASAVTAIVSFAAGYIVKEQV